MKIYQAKTVFTCVCEDAPVQSGNRPENIVSYMRGAFDETPMNESFWVLFLNRKNVITGRQQITVGTLTAALAHPREVFRAAILASAAAIVCVHNHPSGDPAPSAGDMHVTRMIRDSAKILDIEFLDHIIVGDATLDPNRKGYFSFREAGLV